MMRLIKLGMIGLSSIVLLSACNMNSPTVATPTVETELIETPTEPPTITPTLTPIPASDTPSVPTETSLPTDQPILETPTPTFTAAPPTQIPTSTPTQGPVEYVIQADDTLMYIIQLPQHGYDYELDVAQEVVDLNENMSSIDFLPPVGSTILIPLPTATETPVEFEATQETKATLGVDGSSGADLPQGVSVGCYEVQEDDSLVSIATNYNTTLEIMSQLNPDLNWFNCEFDQPSGGPSCSPTIQIGQCIDVPQPTPVPTFTLTPSGLETPTPTPTYPAPRMLYPVNNVVVPPGRFDLQWVGVAGLTSDDEYLVEITDVTSGQKLLQVTESTSFTMLDSFVPSDGQAHTIQWRVSVARKNESGVYGYVGGTGEWRVFDWMSQ